MPSEIDLRFGKLDRQPAAERIADQLMASIVDRKLDPGAALPSEQRLGEMFGVSRPVIREALRHLSALRIIELAPGRRPRVRPLTGDLLRTFFQWALSLNEASLLELHELRRGVEGECVLLAAQRRTEEEVLALRQLARRMRDCLDDHPAYTELDVQFHLAIADAARNQLLSHLASSIRAPMERTIRRGLWLTRGDPAELETVQSDHEAIVDALAARDAPAARLAMDRHFDRAVTRFMASGIEDLDGEGEPAG
ncbi:MAG: FadR/GntR family transcriptional regulator [Candidatus Dormiibacterota bacterium]